MHTTRWRALAALLLSGSLGCNKTAVSSDADDPEPAPQAQHEEPGAEVDAPAVETPPTAVADGSDVDAVLQAVLTHDAFAPYLHPEVRGRVPVRVSGKALPNEPLSLSLHGKPVERVEAPAAGPVVEIQQWSVSEGTARVALRYDVEGVRGAFELGKDGGHWRVVQAQVVEQ